MKKQTIVRKVRNDAPTGNSSRQGGVKPSKRLSNRPMAPASHFKGGGPAHRGGPGFAKHSPPVLVPVPHR